MAKYKLKAKQVETAKPGTRKSDGGGLYLVTRSETAKSWVLITNRNGVRRERGLGSASVVSLAEARKLAEAAREEGDRVKVPTFYEFAKEKFTFWNKNKNWAARTYQQYISTLELHMKPLHKMPVDKITTADVLKCVKPSWGTEIGSKTLDNMRLVFSAARAEGHRDGENPADWDILKHTLTKRRVKQHRPAMPLKDVPKFYSGLPDTVYGDCLRLLILTALRSGEARGLEWSEVDLEKGIITIPANKMKARKLHKVPLSIEAVELLKRQKTKGARYVFASGTGGQINQSTLQRGLTKDTGATVHGFRTCFRGWVSEETTFDSEAAEIALAHTVGTAVTRSYMRSDLLERRRPMMSAWAAYVTAG